jgi:transcriptional regulator with XRE-family HTH domain
MSNKEELFLDKLSKLIKEYLEAEQSTAADLAEKTKLSKATISRYMNNKGLNSLPETGAVLIVLRHILGSPKLASESLKEVYPDWWNDIGQFISNNRASDDFEQKIDIRLDENSREILFKSMESDGVSMNWIESNFGDRGMEALNYLINTKCVFKSTISDVYVFNDSYDGNGQKVYEINKALCDKMAKDTKNLDLYLPNARKSATRNYGFSVDSGGFGEYNLCLREFLDRIQKIHQSSKLIKSIKPFTIKLGILEDVINTNKIERRF